MTVWFQHETHSREDEWRSWWLHTQALSGKRAWEGRGGWYRGINWSKVTVNKGGIWARETEQEESICPICWAKSGGGIHREMKGDMQISGEPEAVWMKNSQRNGPIFFGSKRLPSIRRSTQPQLDIRRLASKRIDEHQHRMVRNGSCLRTEWALWKERHVTKGSAVVVVT